MTGDSSGGEGHAIYYFNTSSERYAGKGVEVALSLSDKKNKSNLASLIMTTKLTCNGAVYMIPVLGEFPNYGILFMAKVHKNPKIYTCGGTPPC